MPEKQGQNKKAFILINVILIQALLVLVMGAHVNFWSKGDSGLPLVPIFPLKGGLVFFISAGLILTTIALVLVGEVERMAEEEYRSRDRLTRLEKAEEMIRVLRAHRHDFLNHLSVISGLVQLKRNDAAVSYIKETTGEMKAAGQVINLAQSELAALILTKMSDAEALGIKLVADIKTKLEGLKINSTELVSILGNLIDNALYAVKDLEGRDRKVNLQVIEEGGSYSLTVSNPGPPIPEELHEEIFKTGFTTKGSEGSGYGLSIVKDLVGKNGGLISLTSGHGEDTAFTVCFPQVKVGPFPA